MSVAEATPGLDFDWEDKSFLGHPKGGSRGRRHPASGRRPDPIGPPRNRQSAMKSRPRMPSVVSTWKLVMQPVSYRTSL